MWVTGAVSCGSGFSLTNSDVRLKSNSQAGSVFLWVTGASACGSGFSLTNSDVRLKSNPQKKNPQQEFLIVGQASASRHPVMLITLSRVEHLTSGNCCRAGACAAHHILCANFLSHSI